MVRFRALTPVVCPAVLLLVVIGFYWKLTLTNQYTWLDQPDTVYQVMPWLQAQAVEWHRGHFPLWDPHLWAGQPFIGQLQTGTLNPLNWLLFSMPLQHGFLSRGVLHWYFVLIHYVAALFGYLLCRDLRLSRTASLLAGSAFALGGFMGDCGWPQILCSAMWLPLVLMFYLRVLRDERPVANSAMCGSTFGMAFLSGHHNVPFFFAIVLSGLWLHFLLSSMKPDRARRALYCLVWGGCLSLIAAVQILPAHELGIRSIRWVNAPAPVAWDQTVPYSVHAGLSLYPTAIIGMVIPGFESHTNPFIGLVVISLALFGVVTRWHEAAVRILGAIALWGLLFSMGSANLVHGLLYAVLPYLDKARSPNMAIVIFHLGAAGLAAYGLDSCFPARADLRRWNRNLLGSLVALGALLYLVQILLITVRPEKGREYYWLSLAALVAFLLAGIYSGWARAGLSHRSARWLLLALMLVELNNVSTANYRLLNEPGFALYKLSENHDIAEFLKARGEPVRVDVDSTQIPYNFGDWFGIDQLGGYQPAVLKDIIANFSDAPVKNLLSVNYHVGRTPNGPHQVQVFEGVSGLKVFHDDDAMPRIRVLPQMDKCTDDVRIRRYDSTRIELDVAMACKGTLVVADAWFPGWTATIDGSPAAILQAHGMVRGVMVDAGTHRVVMRYRPMNLYLGVILTALGLVLCATLQVLTPSRRAAKKTY